MELYRYQHLDGPHILAFLSLNLPRDVKRKIYNEHFKEAIIYNKKYCILMRQVESPECQRLNPTNLKPMIESLIQRPNFVAYVRYKNALFSKIYEEHYIKGNKQFIKMDMLTSLIASWLMYLYH